MIELTHEKITRWRAEARQSAALIEHAWDRRALEWILPPRATIVEVGGYKGRFTLQAAQRWPDARILVFEPQAWAAETIRALDLGERVEVYEYALTVTDGPHQLKRYGTDGATLIELSDAGFDELITGVNATTAIRALTPQGIDLLLCNIEGYEMAFIPHIINNGIRPIRLMVQWHGDHTAIQETQEILRHAGYTSPWSYGNVLEAWQQ